MNTPPLRAALLGTGIAHSLSPFIHGQAARRRGVALEYGLQETGPGNLPARLAQARTQGLAGLNLTAPLKQAVIPRLASLDDTARRAQSVNLLLPVPDGWHGRSTDGAGFLAALDLRGFAPARVRILGSGGAARAVAHALRERWPGLALELACRRPGAARELCRNLPGPAPVVCPVDEAIGAPLDLLVNATPRGMAGGPAGAPWAGPAGLEHVHTVFDLVSVPCATDLLQSARAAGCRTIPGVEMLVAQAAPAFEAWTGREFPLAALSRLCLLRLALGGRLARPIVLIGFMGSGKSTLAPLLGEALALRWLDADAELERRCGQTLPELFARGEPGFRTQERDLFRTLLEPGGPAVIAAGGGMAAQPGFFGEFATRAYFVALDGEPDLLAGRVLHVPGGPPRPLLDGATPEHLATLLASRRSAYLQAPWRVSLRPGEGPLATLDRILETLEPALLESEC